MLFRSRHPYMAPRTLRKLLKARQLKGGWSTLEELVKDDILTREEAARLAPYLQFGVRKTELKDDSTSFGGEVPPGYFQ